MVARTLIARWLLPVNLECLVVTVACIGLTLLIGGGDWYTATYLGFDPYEQFGRDVSVSDFFILVYVNATSAACCLVMPVRSHLSWIVPTWGSCLFCAMTLIISSPHPRSLPIVWFSLCGLNALSVLGGVRNEARLREVVKQQGISEKQRQAFSHVLNRFCDCLLQLGSDFTIMGPSQSFAAMLFLTHVTTLQGTCFCDHFASKDDHDLFVAAMHGKYSEAELLPLHLKDAQGHEFQVHIYFASFNDPDGFPYYILGIVEAREEARSEIQENSYGRRGLAAAPSETVAESDLSNISIVFDDSPSLKLFSCTPGFARVCGPVSDEEYLLDWISEREEFVKYVQCVGNHYLSMPQFEGLVLRPPSATRAGVEYSVKLCSLDAVCDLGHYDERTENRLLLRVSLSGVRQLRRRRESSAVDEESELESGRSGAAIRNQGYQTRL